MRKLAYLLTSIVSAISLGAAAWPFRDQAKPVDRSNASDFFETKVRPILAERCFSCHSDNAKEPKGGLKLDTRRGMVTGGAHGPVIAEGNPAASRLLSAINYEDPGLKMPPEGKLQAAEIAAIAAWVKMGAPWPDTGNSRATKSTIAPAKFWAFVPPARRKPPALHDDTWPKSSLDRFVLAALERRHLRPAPPADRSTLIRRVTLDITGLPPTIQEVREFVNDRKPGAFERVVDRLLASPAFGECWARHWLDVARYADSNGLDENLVYTQAWRYRDYVIRAFNEDKPIDRFIQEQIAGDLLPPLADEEANHDRIIATGFLSLGPKMLAEDDPVKQEMDLIDEQVDTLGKAFMGVTLGCARCHDHKFDPFPQTDYYALASIFKSTRTMVNYKNMAEWQEIPLASKSEVEDLARIDAKLETARKKRESIVKEAADKLLQTVKSRFDDYRVAVAEALESTAASALDPVMADKKDPPQGATVIEAEEFVEGNVLKDRDRFGKAIGVLVNAGQYPNRVVYRFDLPAEGPYQLDLRYASGDPRPIRISVNGVLVAGAVASEVTGGFMPENQRWFAAGIFQFRPGKNEVVFERESYFPHIDKFLLVARPGHPITRSLEQIASARDLNPAVVQILADKLKREKRTELAAADIELPDNPERLFSAEDQASIKAVDETIAAIRKQRPVLPRAMAVSEGMPVDLKVHLRGNYLTLGTQCSRGFPAVLAGNQPPSIPPRESGRLELARWLTRPDHPLTSRVFVNRVWRWMFGAGIVKSVDNFGTLGDRPTDPALLDWLATTFVEDGWSLKKLLRRIVLSSTYRMGDRFDARAAAIDPENSLHWRHQARRLDAEAIRDSILAVSGLLDRKIGGSLMGFRDREYVTSTANSDPVNYKVNRRSVYLPVIRSALYDVYTAFDFGDPTVTNGDRPVTTVAPQALFMMNSSLVADAVKALSERMAAQGLDDTPGIIAAYETCLSRQPTAREIDRASRYLARLDGEYAIQVADTKARRQKVWQSLFKAIISSSEFIFVR